VGTSSSAAPKGIRRTRAAIRERASGQVLTTTLLSDFDENGSISRNAFSGSGVVAGILAAYRIAEEVRQYGSGKAIDELTRERGLDASMPGVLSGLLGMMSESTPPDILPSVLDAIAKRAFKETVVRLLQGSEPVASLPRSALEKNLGDAVVNMGVRGILSLFMGNYVAGLTLFYTGKYVAERLTTPDVRGAEAQRKLESEVREKAHKIGVSIADRLDRQIALKTFDSTEFGDVAALLDRIIRQELSNMLEGEP
jgi:hypothetical protein